MSSKEKDKDKIILMEDKFKKSHQMTDIRGILPLAQYRTENLIAKYVQQFNLNFADHIARKQDMSFCIPINVIKDWYPDRKSWKRDLESAVDQLMSTKVEIRYQEGGWTKGWLIGQASLMNDGLYLKFSPDVMQAYLIQKEGYSLLDYSTMRYIDNRAAYVFYELCCKWRRAGSFEFTPDQMTERFQVKYDANKLFDRIIKPAHDKLRTLYEEGKSDICFDYEVRRGGRGRGGSVLSWKFIIISKEIQKRKEQETRQFTKFLNSFFEKETPMKRAVIMEQVNIMPYDKLCELNQRIEKLQSGELATKDDRVRYICHILIQGFGINPNSVPDPDMMFKIPDKKDKKRTTRSTSSVEASPSLFAPEVEIGFPSQAKWNLFMQTIREVIGNSKYDTWIKPLVPLKYDEDKNVLLIKVPSKFFYEYIEDNFLEAMIAGRDRAFPGANVNYMIGNSGF